MTLLEIFEQVLKAEYRHTNEGISYCVDVYNGESLVILFEKSNGHRDWSTNFNFWPKNVKDIFKCHRGFLRGFNNVKPYLTQHIQDPRIKRILIAGYSHGAALALLTYAYAVTKRPDIRHHIEGYGYGCPRVIYGNPSAEFYNIFANFTVIRNCKDIVTHVPPMIFGYRHVGNLRHIGKHGWYGLVDSHRPEAYRIELMKLQDEFGI